jgi:hypothetical protein
MRHPNLTSALDDTERAASRSIAKNFDVNVVASRGSNVSRSWIVSRESSAMWLMSGRIL